MGAARSSCGGQCIDGIARLFAASAREKRLVVIVGPSGVGKSTLIKRLMGEFPGCFGFSVSHTTRQPRPGEVHGTHYHFAAENEMKAAIDEGKFIEHAQVHGNYYGTSFAAVQEVMCAGRVCLLDIDVQGAEQVKASSLSSEAAFLFVAPPCLAVLEERLRGRGTETEEKVQLRLKNARKELAFAEQRPDFFNETVVSGELETAYRQFEGFMRRHCGRACLQVNGVATPRHWLLPDRSPRSPTMSP
mmetsp:Transcript_28151/g.80929  ORF Transcript_28151/g.80929 Transcript_28151/m.80929 type:complete len:246 (-) Transcript_28151:133-870(-)